VQRMSFVATLGIAVIGMVGCGGSSLRMPIEPPSAEVTARAGGSTGGTPVPSRSPTPLLLGGPGRLQPQHASAFLPTALPAYEGVWSGQSIRRECIEAGGAVGVACRSLPQRNQVRVEIRQAGAEVRAVLMLGGQRAVLAGRIRPEGTLMLRGGGGSRSHTITVDEWHTTIEQTRINGTFSYVISADDERLGSVTVLCARRGSHRDCERALRRRRRPTILLTEAANRPWSRAQSRLCPSGAKRIATVAGPRRGAVIIATDAARRPSDALASG
jgi:hypothetical protein